MYKKMHVVSYSLAERNILLVMYLQTVCRQLCSLWHYTTTLLFKCLLQIHYINDFTKTHVKYIYVCFHRDCLTYTHAIRCILIKNCVHVTNRSCIILKLCTMYCRKAAWLMTDHDFCDTEQLTGLKMNDDAIVINIIIINLICIGHWIYGSPRSRRTLKC